MRVNLLNSHILVSDGKDEFVRAIEEFKVVELSVLSYSSFCVAKVVLWEQECLKINHHIFSEEKP